MHKIRFEIVKNSGVNFKAMVNNFSRPKTIIHLPDNTDFKNSQADRYIILDEEPIEVHLIFADTSIAILHSEIC